MLECRGWERSKERFKHYRSREPEKTVLYRLVSSYRDELPLVWEERYQSEYGVLRQEVLDALDEYLNCGLLCHGAARVYCDTCKHSLLVAFSCKRRGMCPSCSANRAVLFAEHLEEEVLVPVPHRHTVCSVPKRLRPYFRYDRSLNDILFEGASDAFKHVLGDQVGLVLTLQTAGDLLNWNPHLHGAVANGLFGADGSFYPFQSIDTEAITNRFRDNVLSALRKRDLIDDGVVAQILSQKHSGFSIWVGEPFESEKSNLFVARYIERGPLSLERLSIEDDIVTYTSKDGVAKDFEGLDFLALLTSHIPKRWECITRYYGYYSCRARGKRGQSSQKENITPHVEEVTVPSSSWARCMKQVFEFDPLECPKCKGVMRIVAFLHDELTIKNIMDSQGIPHPEPPKKIPLKKQDPFPDEIFPDS